MVDRIRPAQHRLQGRTVANVQAMELDPGPHFFEIVFVACEQVVDHFHIAVRLIEKHPDQRRADESGPSCNNVPFHIFFATATSDSPGQGSSPSTRRQNHTVLSNNLSAGRLMALRPSSFPKIHQESAPILFSWYICSILNPVCPSSWPSSSRENRRSWPMPWSSDPYKPGPCGTSTRTEPS